MAPQTRGQKRQITTTKETTTTSPQTRGGGGGKGKSRKRQATTKATTTRGGGGGGRTTKEATTTSNENPTIDEEEEGFLFNDKYRMIVIDTESKQFDNPTIPDPPFVLVWEIAIIPITDKLTVKRKIYNFLMKHDESVVCVKKLPAKIKKGEWDTAEALVDKNFQKKLKRHLNNKFWIGWNVSRIDAQNIKKIFTEIDPPEPAGIFDVLNWVRAIGLRKSRKLPDLKLSTASHHFKIERSQKHRAEDDARLCLEVFLKILKFRDMSLEATYRMMQSRRSC